ncbi:MAG: hypothetical protein WCJ39_02865 [bacterium]
MYVDTKDGQKRRQLQELFEQFQNETSFYTRTAVLFQFRKIAGQNVEKDNQHLLAGLRQLGKRGEEIATMFSLISAQLDSIESYVTKQKNAATDLFADLYGLFYVRNHAVYEDFNERLLVYLQAASGPAPLTVEPYAHFFTLIHELVGPLQYKK